MTVGDEVAVSAMRAELTNNSNVGYAPFKMGAFIIDHFIFIWVPPSSLGILRW